MSVARGRRAPIAARGRSASPTVGAPTADGRQRRGSSSTVFVPEVAASRYRRPTLSMLALVAVVGSIGFTFGRNNDRFMTCPDVAIASAAEPDNCAK